MSGPANGSRAGYETARLKLARLRLSGADARAAAMRQVAEIGARALGVDVVSVWALRDEGKLECACQFRLSSLAFTGGEVFDGRAFPSFMAAMFERRLLSVSNIRDDPRTAEIRSLLDAESIAALMAAPIIRDGGVAGLVSYGHVGAPRGWTQKERDFAACTADIASLFLEQADRLEIEAALHARREQELSDEKMAALGLMARSIAHDVNDVLGALDMIGAALETDGEPRVQAHGSEVRRAVALGGRLVEQLVLFGEAAPAAHATADLAALIRAIEPVLHRLMKGARLNVDLPAERATAAVAPAEMEQVVLNLCINAAEAVDGGGQVRVEVRDPRPDEPISPTMIVLAVVDDGRGMDAETQARIFEPYYSRKGAGHGIGLATVYGIVRRRGGTILVDSAPGSGTTFRIALPRGGGGGGGGGGWRGDGDTAGRP